MLVRCVLGLLLLQAALSFGGFDFTGDDGTIYHVDEVGEEVRAELEANGCDVDCTEMCWYLADGDMFIKCAGFCGCEELIEEKVEEIVTERSGPAKEPDDEIVLRARRSGPAKEPDDEIVLRGSVNPHKSWKTQLPTTHKAWKTAPTGNPALLSSKPEEPEAEPTAAYGDCSIDCSKLCATASDFCLGKCSERFCATRGWKLWEYLGTLGFLGIAAVGVSYFLSGLKAKKTGYLLEDSTHRL